MHVCGLVLSLNTISLFLSQVAACCRLFPSDGPIVNSAGPIYKFSRREAAYSRRFLAKPTKHIPKLS